MIAVVIPSPVMTNKISSSMSPRQIRKMLRAGIKLENGIGKGKDKNAAEIIIERPHKI